MKPIWFIAFVAFAGLAFAQIPSEPSQSQASMKQLMLDLIYPSSNEILLLVNRGETQGEGKKTDAEWAAVRRSALTLAESGNLLTTRGRARDQADWTQDAKMLADVGMAAYKAAQAKDFPALAALTDELDASCTTCHKQYRPNVFPRREAAPGGSR